MGQGSVMQLSHVVADRLAAEGAFGSARPVVRTFGGEKWIGLEDRWLLRVVPSGERYALWTRPVDGGPWGSQEVDGLTDLEERLPSIEASVRAWATRLSPSGLVPGRRYRVARAFDDHYGNAFAAGETLTFVDRSFQHHEDGHTLRFEERTMWLRGGTPAYEDFGLHVVGIDP